MKSIPGGFVRRVAGVLTLAVSVTLSGCGGEESGGSSAGSPTDSASESATESPAEPGANANGDCGGGEFGTKTVRAAKGVELTVPADWKVQSAGRGRDVRLFGPDEDADDGQVVVEDGKGGIDQAVEAVEKLNSLSEKSGERELELEGFDAARMLNFVDDGSFTVNVVAVGADGLRVIAYWIEEEAPDEQAAIESCLSSLTRTG